jgi:hypothetical protein
MIARVCVGHHCYSGSPNQRCWFIWTTVVGRLPLRLSKAFSSLLYTLGDIAQDHGGDVLPVIIVGVAAHSGSLINLFVLELSLTRSSLSLRYPPISGSAVGELAVATLR